MDSGLSAYYVPALLVISLLLLLHLLKTRIQGYAFAVFMEWFSGVYNKEMHSFKVELFQDLGEQADGQADSPLTILEIGLGTGTNFKYYPEGSVVLGVEPNENFAKYLAKRAAEFSPRVRLERTVVGRAEDLRGQLDDSSVDAVVCTLVLCSVDDVDAVVMEAKRVLKPGGKFYFLEHVAADPGSWTRLFQRLLHSVWLYAFDRCRLMRTPWVNLENAGFSQVTCKKFTAPPLSFSVIRPHIMGVCTK